MSFLNASSIEETSEIVYSHNDSFVYCSLTQSVLSAVVHRNFLRFN